MLQSLQDPRIQTRSRLLRGDIDFAVDHIAKPDHLAVEDVRLVVKFYLSRLRH
ncbi:MAG: hypothetical protein L6300_06585 [Syntrophaceae bacterium]|nr:hypothetical protein [Pseudomonadota bacterium]MCG2739891.1 hypothetical protein [Syntrophaceae bacterium]